MVRKQVQMRDNSTDLPP